MLLQQRSERGKKELWSEWLVEVGFPILAGDESSDGLVLEPEIRPERVVEEGLPTLTAVEGLVGLVKLWPGRLVEEGFPILARGESSDVLEPEIWPERVVEEGLPTLIAAEALNGLVKLWPGRLVEEGFPIFFYNFKLHTCATGFLFPKTFIITVLQIVSCFQLRKL